MYLRHFFDGGYNVGHFYLLVMLDEVKYPTKRVYNVLYVINPGCSNDFARGPK